MWFFPLTIAVVLAAGRTMMMADSLLLGSKRQKAGALHDASRIRGCFDLAPAFEYGGLLPLSDGMCSGGRSSLFAFFD